MSVKITKALHEVMSEVGYVQKTKKSPIGYKYAGEAGVLEALRPAMVKAGLLLLPCVTKLSDVDEFGNTHVIVEYTLAHKDGDVWPHKIAMAGSGNDKNKAGVSDKGVYKAITGANKYLLFKLFQIETGDDPESEVQEPANEDAPKQQFMPEPQATKAANELIENVKGCVTPEELKAYVGTAAFKAIADQLSDARYDEVKKAVRERFPKKEKAA